MADDSTAQQYAAALADALRKLLAALGPAVAYPRDVADAIANADAVLHRLRGAGV